MNNGSDDRIQRHGLVIDLVPEMRDEYLRLHAAVWPEVEAALSAHHVTNYSIFLVGDTLFAYYEYTGEDHDADMAGIARDEVTQRWWALTDPCQKAFRATHPDSGGWQEAREIWHLR
ncbi:MULTISPECIES: L-rhamnose mutarotase [unclassified Microbacterium]|uniref:L-rhamnose mutarotase n=1 Tax=unclassified Microbacterium TaxID=2609290 RepID=UPI00177C14EB|nr:MULTISPECIES: L-rhamnose mutarotase [unclassified Microbacterium]MBD8207929.1 L-rhamnose mutarotase [Microbacterium sp. CFBP 8801]MBD8477179.1 L-rhamnose mutarotase [Microbacterium sp. CFBP 8794]MBD8511071.1 L-rhamnose mutarotase [Microbacterium sp. CFBP 8790]